MSSAPVVAPATDMPDEPTMGGVTKLSATDFVAWPGGKPKADWTDLDAAAPATHVSPNQL